MSPAPELSFGSMFSATLPLAPTATEPSSPAAHIDDHDRHVVAIVLDGHGSNGACQIENSLEECRQAHARPFLDRLFALRSWPSAVSCAIRFGPRLPSAGLVLRVQAFVVLTAVAAVGGVGNAGDGRAAFSRPSIAGVPQPGQPGRNGHSTPATITRFVIKERMPLPHCKPRKLLGFRALGRYTPFRRTLVFDPIRRELMPLPMIVARPRRRRQLLG